MDIQQLIYFVTVAKTGTYVAASRQLYISQPALSKSIKKMENRNRRVYTAAGGGR